METNKLVITFHKFFSRLTLRKINSYRLEIERTNHPIYDFAKTSLAIFCMDFGRKQCVCLHRNYRKESCHLVSGFKTSLTR